MNKHDNHGRRYSNLDLLITTTYEKVMIILNNVTKKLKNIEENPLVSDMLYVIQKIESKSLYSYSQETKIKQEGNEKENEEVKNLLDSLNEYSELNFFKKNKKDNIFTKTAKSNKSFGRANDHDSK